MLTNPFSVDCPACGEDLDVTDLVEDTTGNDNYAIEWECEYCGQWCNLHVNILVTITATKP